MSEEIKEILDKLSNRKQETLIQGLRECQLKDIEHPFITKEEYIDKILDYITKLQEKLKETADLCSKHFVKIQVLKEELKSANESITWWQNRFNAIERDNKNYKSRCEKAISYIKENGCFNEEYKLCTKPFNTLKLDDLLDILQGVDKE